MGIEDGELHAHMNVVTVGDLARQHLRAHVNDPFPVAGTVILAMPDRIIR